MTSRKNWWKYAGAVVMSLAVNLSLHRAAAVFLGIDVTNVGLPQSVVIKKGWFLPAISLALLLALTLMTVLFAIYRGHLPGRFSTRGLRFMGFFSGLWFIGFLESALVLKTPLKNEIITALVDCSSILLLGWLLGRSHASDGPREKTSMDTENYTPIAVLAVLYVIGRYVSYHSIGIESAYLDRPALTALWTITMAVYLGWMYWLVGRWIHHDHSMKNVFGFAGLVYGVNWMVFNLFILLFYEASVIDLMLRCAVDSVFLGLGIALYRWMYSRARTAGPVR